MQSYDSNDKLIRSEIIDHFCKVQEEMSKPEVAHVRVGHIPEVGHEFETNGLRFKVIMSNNKKGRFTAEIV